jgi:hypothetical protein
MLLIIQHYKITTLKILPKFLILLIVGFSQNIITSQIHANDERISPNELYEKFGSLGLLQKKSDLSIQLKFSEKTRKELSRIVTEWANIEINVQISDKYFPAKIILNSKDEIDVKFRLKGKLSEHTGCLGILPFEDKDSFDRCNIFSKQNSSINSNLKKLDGPSFRIKIIDKEITHINGMREFNIQSYYRRSKNIEFWFDLMKKFKLPAIRTKSINFSVNNITLDNYYIEDRFTKNFQEYNKKKESVIFYLDDRHWGQDIINMHFSKASKIDTSFAPTKIYRNQSSERIPIKYYKAQKLAKKNDPLLNSYLREGYSLLWGWRTGKIPIEKVFDKDSLIKSYLIADIACDPHPLIEHINARFYYNPYVKKFELLLNDFVDIPEWVENYNGNLFSKNSCDNELRAIEIFKFLVKDDYHDYAKKLVGLLTEDSFNKYTKHDSRTQGNLYRKYINRSEQPKYVPSANHYLQYDQIKNRLNNFAYNYDSIKKNILQNKIGVEKLIFQYPDRKRVYGDTPYIYPLNVYYVKNINKNYDELWFENLTNLEITIDRVFNKNNKKLKNKQKYLANKLENLTINPTSEFNDIKKIIIEKGARQKYKMISKMLLSASYKDSRRNEYNINLDLSGSRGYLKDTNVIEHMKRVKKDYTSVIIPVHYAPSKPYELKDLYENGNPDMYFLEANLTYFLGKHPYIKMEGNNFLIENLDNLHIKYNLSVPDGFSLTIRNSNIYFSDGMRISLNGAPLKIINSKLQAINPKKGWIGIIVNNSYDKKSLIKESILEDIRYINSDITASNWPLTGAITFYKSDVEIISSAFLNNKTEDMLNIVSSDYKIIDSDFKNTFSDAFDSDFSNGVIIGTTYDNIGNDAVDISGSKLSMENSHISGAKDKAISIGENSYFNGKNIIIKKSNIGIVSKDLSKSLISDSSFSEIKDSVYMSYQKKGEFGPGNIIAKNNKVNSYDTLLKLDNFSKISIDNKTINGGDLNIDYLYKN